MGAGSCPVGGLRQRVRPSGSWCGRDIAGCSRLPGGWAAEALAWALFSAPFLIWLAAVGEGLERSDALHPSRITHNIQQAKYRGKKTSKSLEVQIGQMTLGWVSTRRAHRILQMAYKTYDYTCSIFSSTADQYGNWGLHYNDANETYQWVSAEGGTRMEGKKDMYRGLLALTENQGSFLSYFPGECASISCNKYIYIYGKFNKGQQFSDRMLDQ